MSEMSVEFKVGASPSFRPLPMALTSARLSRFVSIESVQTPAAVLKGFLERPMAHIIGERQCGLSVAPDSPHCQSSLTPLKFTRAPNPVR